MWTPQRLSSGAGGSASPFWWRKKKKRKEGKNSGGGLGLENCAFVPDHDEYFFHGGENPSPLVQRSPVSYAPSPSPLSGRQPASFVSSLRSLFPLRRRPPTAATALRRRRLTGTVYGRRRGRANFAVQENPSSEPLLLLELAIATDRLVKEMAAGAVRILLECDRQRPYYQSSMKKKRTMMMGMWPFSPAAPPPSTSLWEEPVWSMFCNGRRSGFAVSHSCGEDDLRVLRAIPAVSAGAGVLSLQRAPERSLEKGGLPLPYSGGESPEVMYMRAKFERVVESSDSEALYMVNPDGGRAGGGRSGPELSIFLLRL
ncbi:unnamed protein product [Spirodela intermedia]|uniref:Uncharacterized protein n=1 Tax=Spirodela intermedia TaxID=51605 RepID=A0A7I8L508_SPIIN|nr:unnamed protein product [Spirodela intermedia]